MERIDFQHTDISNVLDRLPDHERNSLPFGVVKLDARGVILAYNMAEAEISGINPADVIGKNFFLDVAVCTQRPEFYGRFRDAMDNNKVLNLIFDYEFQNALYAPVHEPIKVRVHMASTRDWGGEKIVWLMVKRVGKANALRPQVTNVAAQPAAAMPAPAHRVAQQQLDPRHATALSQQAAIGASATAPAVRYANAHAHSHAQTPPNVNAATNAREILSQTHAAFAALDALAPPAAARALSPQSAGSYVPPALMSQSHGPDILVRFDDV